MLNANLLHALPDTTAGEVFEDILSRGPLRIERIVSQGQSSPEGSWYDQEEDEWVLVLQGGAGLEIEGEATHILQAGDHMFLPAHRRHRVAWTSGDEPTVWLAVWLKPGGDQHSEA